MALNDSEVLRRQRISEYLERDQELDHDAAVGVRKQARSAVHHGALPAAVSATAAHGAPIAIWLGLLLDGIPNRW